MLYILNRSVSDGRRIGLAAVGGLELGNAVHALAAALGLSAVLATSAIAFNAVKWVGVAYLIFTGARILRHPPKVVSERASGHTASKAFRQGIVVNVFNPKVALFFLAFLPQFIAPTAEDKPLAFLLLGLLFNFNGLWFNIGWALGAVWLANRAGVVKRNLLWLARFAGAMFVAFGIKLALTESPHA